MNTVNILRLADVIEKLPHSKSVRWETLKSGQFNMSYYKSSCGSPSCIAGWADEMFVAETGNDVGGRISENAAKWLDIDEEWADYNLFEPNTNCNHKAITPAQAAKALRSLVKFKDEKLSMDSLGDKIRAENIQAEIWGDI
jgi:hypothetical protein